MFPRVLSALVAAAVIAGTAVVAQAAETLNFGIISTESSQNLKTVWDPFLKDMEKKTGLEIKAFFASDYAGIIEGMRFGKVDLCWIGNKGAISCVDRADGSIFAQTVAADGSMGYYSLMIAHKDCKIKTLEDMFAQAKDLNFGNGDPNSTSGYLVPSYYVFAQNNVDPKQAFKRMLSSSHEANALSVANKQVDVATFNTEGMDRLKLTHPDKAEKLRVIWKSPLIPSDPLVWRNSLSSETKQKIDDFIFSYGVTGDNVAAEKAVLEGLAWAPFRRSNNDQLIPLRQLELFKEKSKLEANTDISAAEKAERIAKIDAALEALNK